MSLTYWRLRTGLPPATFGLLVALVGVYIVQMLLSLLFGFRLEYAFGLSVAGIMKGQLWQFLTYQFLHGGPFHLLLNVLMFLFLGAEVERTVGTRGFLVLYVLCGILGGLGWLMLTYPYEGICIGASAAIFGVLSAFAVLFPHREITLLLFFVLPLTMKAWVLAVGLGIVQLLFSISPNVGGIAYTAHLAGAVAGFVYTAALFRPEWLRIPKKRWETHRSSVRARREAEENVEIDRLLDKIAKQGIQSLTAAERRFLEEASRRRTSAR